MNYENLVISIIESLGILLVNIIVVPIAYGLAGATVTMEQAFYVSASFFLLRIIWFYFVLSVANWKAER